MTLYKDDATVPLLLSELPTALENYVSIGLHGYIPLMFGFEIVLFLFSL